MVCFLVSYTAIIFALSGNSRVKTICLLLLLPEQILQRPTRGAAINWTRHHRTPTQLAVRWPRPSSRRRTVPLIQQPFQHNFRSVERDISRECKLSQGVFVLFIRSTWLGRQEILSLCPVRCFYSIILSHGCYGYCVAKPVIFKVGLVKQLSNWCSMARSSLWNVFFPAWM